MHVHNFVLFDSLTYKSLTKNKKKSFFIIVKNEKNIQEPPFKKLDKNEFQMSHIWNKFDWIGVSSNPSETNSYHAMIKKWLLVVFVSIISQ